MFSSNPRRIALQISLIIVIFNSFIQLFFAYFNDNIDLISQLLSAIVVFIFSYFIIKFAVEKFIYEKIRIIYKNIRQLKLSKNHKEKQLSVTDWLENVNQEVKSWVEDRSKELEDLKKLEKYRREYIGNVSHELKTPIFNIQGYILTLLDGGLEDKNINKDYLLKTEKSINRMISIIQDLEAISQLESGELKLEYTRFDIINLVKEVFDFLEIKAKKKKVKLFITPTKDKQIWVNADKKRIRQVLTNLIENSIKYSSDENAYTKVSFFDMDELILTEVADNGIGVSEADIPRLFERFYRTDKGRSRGQGGTGLGLSIVKHIIEAHEQTINVRSGLGLGTTFGFTLRKA